MKSRGKYVRHTSCRLCKSPNLTKFLDFGDVPLAGGFLSGDRLDDEEFYPLELHFCRNCTLVQVVNAIPGEVLFKNYFYFSSQIKTLVDHFAAFAEEVTELLGTRDPFVVEVGCNDGVFLKPLNQLGVRCLGVDPATNVVNSINAPEIAVVNDFFTEDLARRIRDEHGLADAVVSSYSLAHIDDIIDVMKGIKALLKHDGVFIFEVYYLGIVIDEMQYDMIYHEHVNYYSMNALAHFFETIGMEIFDVQRIPLRAGTMRYYVRNVSGRKGEVSKAVGDLSEWEHAKGLDSLEGYKDFAERVNSAKSGLLDVLTALKQDGKRIIGYGASGRATTIMSVCGIGSDYLDYVVDDAPAKHGFYTPGTHLLIKPWAAAEEPPSPDYALLFAWSFIDEVVAKRRDYLRQGGKFIVPLPEVRVIGA